MAIKETIKRFTRSGKRGRGVPGEETLSAVRRIDRVAPPAGERMVAFTFDDSPCAAPCHPGMDPEDHRGVTEAILETLDQFGAKATFSVFGTTAYNYPDRQGKRHTADWNGVRFRHFPEFGRDERGGIVNQPELARRMVAAGHELVNHSYRHVAFGPSRRLIRSLRSQGFLRGFQEVVEDCRRLHEFSEQTLGFTMRFGRPPENIEWTNDGYSVYDVYQMLGYHYLGASVDGGGWGVSSGDPDRDVREMVDPLKEWLKGDPDALSGQIIALKDGYNMSKRTPVVEGLRLQLELLAGYGYRFVTASALTSVSPLADLPAGDPCFEAAKALLERGFRIAYRNNTLQPDRVVTRSELAVMLCPPGEGMPEKAATGAPHIPYSDVSRSHPYHRYVERVTAMGWLSPRGKRFAPDAPVEPWELREAVEKAGAFYRSAGGGRDLRFAGSVKIRGRLVTRRDAVLALAAHVL